MRTIERTARFKKDFKRLSKGTDRKALQTILPVALTMLIKDEDLPASYRDHALTGNWLDHRDCHIRPDLVLIYSKPNSATLRLVRIGSHAELFD